jgi:hypothetical protein
MKPKFIAGENIPFSLIKALRALGYEVGETAHFGIKIMNLRSYQFDRRRLS